MQSVITTKGKLLFNQPFVQQGRKCLTEVAKQINFNQHNLSSVSSNQQSGYDKQESSYRKYIAPTVLLSLAGAASLKYYIDNYDETHCATSTSKSPPQIFSREEVSKHNSKENRVWVIYANKVYDITEFIDGHPGGTSKIALAAGMDLEPFWDMYAIHKKPEILEILQQYFIGELREEDWSVTEKKQGPFASDPKRHPALISNSKEPFNAETPPVLATDRLITPNDLFYVRNHLPVPDIDENKFNLVIGGAGLQDEFSLSVNDLKKKYKKSSVVAAIQCAGNRRSEMNSVKKVKGLSWSSNAISNAEWSGVLLSDLLKDLKLDENDKNIKHIHFEGADKDPTGAVYGASIPAGKLFKKNMPIMIAYEMNGKPIPRDHGFPLRLVAPGIVGARSVKWLNHIKLSDKEYQGHWQQNDYKPFSPNIDWHNVDFNSSLAIQDLPVTSAICFPPSGSFDESEEEIEIKGYAFSGGGRGIIRVDLSNDNGKTWFTADLEQADQDVDEMYSWTLWKCMVPIPKDHQGNMEVVCKAVDSSCNTQPENVGPVWNLRGVLNNCWHRVTFKILNDDD